MQITKVLFTFALALVVSGACFAQDADKKKDGKGKRAEERALKNTTNQMMKFFAKANLTEEQQEKAKEVIAKHVKDLIAARKAQDEMLTDEQKQNRTEAVAKAKEEGVKGNKVAAAGTKALGLSDEEMKKYNAAKKKVNEVNTKLKEAIMAMLTDEQKAAMPKPRAGGKKGGKKGKKKDKGDDGN